MNITLNDLIEAREQQYKKDGCKIYRILEHRYLNFDYEYTKSDEVIEALEEKDFDVSEYQTEENKKAEEDHEITSLKAREDHTKICENKYCKILSRRSELKDEDMKV